MRESTQPTKVGKSQLSGQPLRLCSTVSILRSVTSGAMAVSSMRYGAWESNLTVISQTLRYISISNDQKMSIIIRIL